MSGVQFGGVHFADASPEKANNRFLANNTRGIRHKLLKSTIFTHLFRLTVYSHCFLGYLQNWKGKNLSKGS